MAIDDVRMKAEVTSARAMSSSYLSALEQLRIIELTRERPSTQSRIQPFKPDPPTCAANSSIPFGQYPIVASGDNRASEAMSHTLSELGVGEDGVCG